MEPYQYYNNVLSIPARLLYEKLKIFPYHKFLSMCKKGEIIRTRQAHGIRTALISFHDMPECIKAIYIETFGDISDKDKKKAKKQKTYLYHKKLLCLPGSLLYEDWNIMSYDAFVSKCESNEIECFKSETNNGDHLITYRGLSPKIRAICIDKLGPVYGEEDIYLSQEKTYVYHNNILCIPASLLYRDWKLISYTKFGQLIKNGEIKIARRASKGNESLITFNDLPEKIKEFCIIKLGDI